jgi:hypothetical protein
MLSWYGNDEFVTFASTVQVKTGLMTESEKIAQAVALRGAREWGGRLEVKINIKRGKRSTFVAFKRRRREWKFPVHRPFQPGYKERLCGRLKRTQREHADL